MADHNTFLLNIHKKAKDKALKELEEELLKSKDWKKLEKLKKMQEQDTDILEIEKSLGKTPKNNKRP
jgi:hypothetical protein